MIAAAVTGTFVGLYFIAALQWLLGLCAAAKKEVPRLTRFNPEIVKL